VHATLQGIFSAVLYFYATNNDDNTTEKPTLLTTAFAPK